MATLETPERSIDLSSLRRWESLCEEIQHPDVELTVEEFAALLGASGDPAVGARPARETVRPVQEFATSSVAGTVRA